MNNTLRTLALSVTLTGALAAAAGAQATDPAVRSSNAGYNAGIFLSGWSVDSDVGNGSGLGIGVQYGYGFGENVSLFGRGGLARVEIGSASARVAHLDLGLRYSFGGTSWALRPFVLGALNATLVTDSDDGPEYLQGRSIGFTTGGGVEYFLSPTLSIDTGLLLSFGDFDSIDATARRLEIGMTIHQ